MSTNTFTDEEVEIILDTLKTKPHYITADEKDKLTIQVEIARKLTTKLGQQGQKGRRSALQVRYKLFQLQKGYSKLKEKPNHHSSVNRQAVKYFKLLDEIFDENKQKKKKTIKNEMITIADNVKEQNSLATYDTYIIKKEGITGRVQEATVKSKYGIQKSREGVLKSNDENSKVRQVTEFADYSFKVPQTTDSISSTANEVEQEIEEIPEEATSDEDESPELRKVRQSFTTELMDSQRLLVAAIKEQDKKYVRSFKDHCKCQETILKGDRYEIKKILRKDREEMFKVLNTIVNAMGKSISYRVETNDDDDYDDFSDSMISSSEAEEAESGTMIEND